MIKDYHYSKKMRVFKSIGKIVAIYTILLNIVILFISFPDFSNREIILIVGILIITIFTVYIIYSWPDVRIDEKSLFIEFLWKRIRINISDIINIKRVNNVPFGAWLISANGLTPFHRLYGIQYGMCLDPSFLIWSNLLDKEGLLQEIQNQIKLSP